MLRSSSKIKTFGVLLSLAVLPVFCAVSASATEVTRNTKFRVNVSDTLAVSVTTPDTWAVGDVDQFLRNRINVAVTSNNAAGFTATMTTKTNVKDLTNTRSSSYVIPTLQNDATVSAFPANYWGFTLDDDRPEPRATALYSPLVNPTETPITILSSEIPASLDQDVYFGAKANASKASGTYQNTVVISVVTGVIDDGSEVDPDDPTPTPSEDPAHDTTPDTPTYDPTNDRTTYTTVTPNDDDTTTTTTEVSKGDTRSQYADPQGVKHKTTTSTTVNEGQPLATGLAVTAAVSAATGFLFFIIAKRRKDEDEEEDENQIQQ